MATKMNRGMLSVDPKHLQAYDQLFLGVLQREGKIELFLDAIFSFLYRKTDFFRFLTKDNPNIGFRIGDANKIVESYFMKYMKASMQAYEDMIKAAKEKEAKIALETPKDKITEVTESKPKPSPKEEIKTASNSTNLPKTLDIDERQTSNGSSTDKYMWSQTYDEVEVTIPVKEDLTVSDIKIDFQQTPSELQVQFKDQEYLKSSLHGPIIKQDSTWSFDKKSKNVSITLAKNSTLWWDRLTTDENPIDLKNIKPERKMEDMTVEEQDVINKLKYDQHLKLQGKHTRKQQDALEKLKAGWNSEGSPFKGQEFDPSRLNMDSIN